MNKLWRRNTGEKLISDNVNLGQVQCQVNWKADINRLLDVVVVTPSSSSLCGRSFTHNAMEVL